MVKSTMKNDDWIQLISSLFSLSMINLDYNGAFSFYA